MHFGGEPPPEGGEGWRVGVLQKGKGSREGAPVSEKETFLPVLQDQRRDQGCDDHDERHSDCDDLVDGQTCRGGERRRM